MTIPKDRNLPRLAVGVDEAMQIIGLGRNTVLELVHSGQLRHVRVGRRIVIPVSALKEYLDRNAVEGSIE